MDISFSEFSRSHSLNSFGTLFKVSLFFLEKAFFPADHSSVSLGVLPSVTQWRSRNQTYSKNPYANITFCFSSTSGQQLEENFSFFKVTLTKNSTLLFLMWYPFSTKSFPLQHLAANSVRNRLNLAIDSSVPRRKHLQPRKTPILCFSRAFPNFPKAQYCLALSKLIPTFPSDVYLRTDGSAPSLAKWFATSAAGPHTVHTNHRWPCLR